jgi:hypothetical protein
LLLTPENDDLFRLSTASLRVLKGRHLRLRKIPGGIVNQYRSALSAIRSTSSSSMGSGIAASGLQLRQALQRALWQMYRSPGSSPSKNASSPGIQEMKVPCPLPTTIGSASASAISRPSKQVLAILYVVLTSGNGKCLVIDECR